MILPDASLIATTLLKSRAIRNVVSAVIFTRAIVETLKNDDFTGVDAILSVVPYYNKPSQEGIYQHYKAIAEATELPIVLYNVPGRTGVNMTAETTLRIARDFKNVVAIKEASGNITQMDDIIKNKPEKYEYFSYLTI